MEVYDYLERVNRTASSEAEKEHFLRIAEVWNNNAACGYAAKAMKEEGIDNESILRVLERMEDLFDAINVEEASAIGLSGAIRHTFTPNESWSGLDDI